MKTALLIIDVQQGLCEGDGKAFASDEVIAHINQVAAKARQAGAPVIFVQHESGPGYLEYASRAWQLADGLQAGPEDLRVRKTTPDSFLGTGLHELLQRRNITELIVCGMHSEFCIDTTTRRALALGYPVRLVEDAHTSAGNAVLSPQQVVQHHNLTLANISSFGPTVRLVTTQALQIAA
ncbi:MAG: isochorismatase family protein [Polaromonas sp.]|nr:isochorismatase family protein [Polaromonas sp.]